MGRSLVENADYTERSKDLGGKRHYERTPPLSGPHFRGRMKADCVISPGENCSSVCRLCRSLWSGGTGQAARLCCAEIRVLHEKLPTGVDTPPANALLAFFWSWEPEKALAHPALAENLDEILSGANLVFRTDGGFVHEDPAVRHAWEACCHSTGDRPQGVCLMTGENDPVESLHPSIKNVAGAQSSGAALVSLQCPGLLFLRQGAESQRPTGKFASFSYTAASRFQTGSAALGSGRFHYFIFLLPSESYKISVVNLGPMLYTSYKNQLNIPFSERSSTL